jgi:hypothetical protein
MAKVWPVYEGSPNTIGDPWAELPLDDAIRVLDLEPEHFLMDLSPTPKFGDMERNLSLLGYRHVVVEVGDDEAKAGWRPGFYRSPLSPAKAFYRLLGRRIEEQLGGNWRVELEEGQDADGDRAIWAWIALRADAPAEEWTRKNRERIQAEVRTAVAESGIPDWVFVRFRKDAEERAAS